MEGLWLRLRRLEGKLRLFAMLISSLMSGVAIIYLQLHNICPDKFFKIELLKGDNSYPPNVGANPTWVR